MPSCLAWIVMFVLIAMLAFPVLAQEEVRDYTCFQTGPSYGAEVDIASDVAIVYGVGSDFPQRAEGWRKEGYTVSLMTGISWGGYGDYYMADGAFKKEEVQTTKSGQVLMHGDSTTVGYNVPTDAYIEFIKKYIEPAVDDGVRAIYLEEPEFWSRSGWSEAFKKEWQRFYGEPWQEPDSSVDAQYRASKLKYEMYFKALREVFAYAKQRAASQGRTLECHVPTHTLINYAHWGIVSPESHLIDIPELDGYIAQVWTGTARTPNVYQGVKKERTFETAYLEFGQAWAMVRPTGKKVWFLADPVEDNPDRSWNDYRRNYECTIVASLMWPEVYRYEVMPWPQRIFQGTYPKVDLDAKSGQREGIPADYATQILAVINALNDMKQEEVVYDAGTRGIGVIVSDTMMFQRAAPQPSNHDLGAFFSLSMPLVKHGVPVEVVQLENSLQPDGLKPYRVLLLTYEGQKPLKAEYHAALADWVKQGGCLIFVDDGSDPYHDVREWWNEQGTKKAKAYDDLFGRLGITEKARREAEPVGAGFVRVIAEKPSTLTRAADGGQRIVGLVGEMLALKGGTLKTQNYLCLRRGPYVAASVLDESVSETPFSIKGQYVDLFDPALGIVQERVLNPNERAVLFDLDWARSKGQKARVVAAAARVKRESASGNSLTFTLRGPKATRANVRVLLPKEPASVSVQPEAELAKSWDPGSSSLLLSFDNAAADMLFTIVW